MNPQNNMPNGYGAPQGGEPNFDGFGGPNISYENYNEPAQAAAPAPAPAPASINVVNANGVISGRRMVDYLWQRIAYCALAFSGVLLVGVIVAVIFACVANGDKAVLKAEKDSMNNKLNGLYSLMGVSSSEDAATVLDKKNNILTGADISKIDKLLTGKFGAGYRVDYADTGLNEVHSNRVFKVVSVAVETPARPVRVVLYGRVASGEWILASFDSDDKVDPCANSSDEEKKALEGIFTCGEPMEEEEKEDEEKSDDSKDESKDEDKEESKN